MLLETKARVVIGSVVLATVKYGCKINLFLIILLNYFVTCGVNVKPVTCSEVRSVPNFARDSSTIL